MFMLLKQKNCLHYIPLKWATVVIAIYAILYMSVFSSVKAANTKECEREKDNDTSAIARGRKFTDPIYYASSIALALSAASTLLSIYKDWGQLVFTAIFVVMILFSFLIQEIILILDTITNFQHRNICSLGISSGLTSVVTLPIYLYYAMVVYSYSCQVYEDRKKLKGGTTVKESVKKESVKKEPVKKEPVKKEPPKTVKKESVPVQDEAPAGYCSVL